MARFREEPDEPDYRNAGYGEEAIAGIVREKFRGELPTHVGTLCHSRAGWARSGYYKGYVVERDLVYRPGTGLGRRVRVVRLDSGQRVRVPNNYFPQIGEIVLAEKGSKQFVFVPVPVFAANWWFPGSRHDRLAQIRPVR